MTLKTRIRFYQQLAVLARAGVPMRTSLQRMEKKVSGPEIATLTRQIEQGQTVGEAFTAAGFSPFECHLVAAGERSAQLETIFDRLSQFWTRELHLGQAIVRSLYYPIVLIHLGILVGALIQFVSTGMGPAIVYLVEKFAGVYLAGFILYVVIRATWKSDAAKGFWLFVPLIGGALSSAFAYRWITALRLEFSAGVPFPDAVADAWRASGYIGSETKAEEGRAGLRSGEPLSIFVQRWRQLPRDWIDFVETGEISGEYEAMFGNMETEAARNWTLAQERLTEWLPKIFGFAVLLVAGYQIYGLMNQSMNGQVDQVQKMIDDATR
jgi:type II secretory pathway component PulF